MSHFMLVPSTACPANCTYCFGPHYNHARMADAVFEKTLEWIAAHSDTSPLEITFHGGEPLTAGIRFYQRALPRLREVSGMRSLRISLQSNLWLIDPETLELFEEHNVHLGTSLDGPEDINDAQRGAGYFRRTMENLHLARQHNVSVGCIATLTSRSAQRWRDVIGFFEKEGMNVSLHAALPGWGNQGETWALPPYEYGHVMERIFEHKLGVSSAIHIEPIDSICQGLSTGAAGSCTFGDCLGKFLAIDPEGGIYPCQRFIGLQFFRLGDIEHHSEEDLKKSPAWQMIAKWQRQVIETCAGCEFDDLCHGGCPYNTLVSGHHALDAGSRDPYCQAYHYLFSSIVERAAADFFSEENLNAIAENPAGVKGLFQRGKTLFQLRSGVL